jgi:hypothetical protein
MFTLRIIIDEIQTNESLGDNYTLVHREYNYEEFCRLYKTVFGTDHVADTDPQSDNYTKSCYAFLSMEGLGKIRPLYKKQLYFVMTDSGKTFDNLTYK